MRRRRRPTPSPPTPPGSAPGRLVLQTGRVYEGGIYTSVYGDGVTDVTLRGVAVEGGGSAQGILLKASQRVTIEGCSIVRCSIGIHAADASCSGITVRDSRIETTSDSGIILLGSGHVLERVSVTDCGFAAGAPTYGVHCVYGKCANLTMRDCRLSRWRDNGISLRGPGAIVESCVAEGTRGHALAYFEQLPVGDPNVIRGCRLAVPDGVAVYLDPSQQKFVFERCSIVGRVDARCPVEGL